MMEDLGCNFKRLGFTELLSTEIAQYAEVEHGMYYASHHPLCPLC
jgi:hypothetical protein